MQDIHDRMPVILERDAYGTGLIRALYKSRNYNRC